jgi:DNA polymerase bacteriophage-type
MPALHLDLESFSECDLGSAGVYRYAEHESTSVNMLGYTLDDEPVTLWLPFGDVPNAVVAAIQERHPTARIVTQVMPPEDLLTLWRNKAIQKRAHNAQFERVVLNGVAGQRLGLPRTEISEWVCTAAKAAASGIPRSLADGADALGTHPKDEGGRIAMLQISKPRKPTKADPSTRWTFENAPDKWIATGAYNIDDVLAERALDDALPDLTESEQKMYGIDQQINETGWAVDLEAVHNILFVVEQYKAQLAKEFGELTRHTVCTPPKNCMEEPVYTVVELSPTQREKVGEWVRANGFPGLMDLTADYLAKLKSRSDLPKNILRVLSIYTTYNAKSVSKLQAMLDAVCADGRLRGMFMFYGAATGRWSSLIVQLQNMMRPVIKDPNAAIEAFAERSIEWIRFLYPDVDLMKVAGSCIRGCLIAGPNSDLIFPDYSGIEDRVNAWFFDEEWVLKAYRDYDAGKGRHLYSLTVCRAFGLDINKFDDEDPRRQQGKVVRLSMGYEGGVSAFTQMAETYQVDLEAMAKVVLPLLPEDALDHAGWMAKNHPCKEVASGEISKDVETACNGLKFLYRKDHPRIRQGWRDLKEAAEKAVEFKGQAFWIPNKRIGFKVETYKGRDWLCMRLPSGRKIKYFKPTWIPPRQSQRWLNGVLEDYTIPGEMRYWGIDTYTRQYMELSTYGGKLDENADQGYSRDILCSALLRTIAAGYKVIATEHDKIVFEVPKGSGSVDELKRLMVQDVPEGLPMTVDGKRLSRYGK